MGKQKNSGFRYYLSSRHLEKYGKWPLERRLKWLLAANIMRQGLPKEIIEIQDPFRRGELGVQPVENQMVKNSR